MNTVLLCSVWKASWLPSKNSESPGELRRTRERERAGKSKGFGKRERQTDLQTPQLQTRKIRLGFLDFFNRNSDCANTPCSDGGSECEGCGVCDTSTGESQYWFCKPEDDWCRGAALGGFPLRGFFLRRSYRFLFIFILILFLYLKY